MAQVVGIGWQSFEEIRNRNIFYVDKTDFIKDWWESEDQITLITRPRRFGKTLTQSMVECFFSVKYANRPDLFEGLFIWNDENYRAIQGTIPVIFLSFADIKDNKFEEAMKHIYSKLASLVDGFGYLKGSDRLSAEQITKYEKLYEDLQNREEAAAKDALQVLSQCLEVHHGKKPIILLDEYDTPLQEAYVFGYWKEMAEFIRVLFNSTFKTNPSLGKALLTGITRVSKESIFSDLNNLKVVTVTTDKYETAFGFTEEEVFAAMDERGLSDMKEMVKKWYDGFVFGHKRDIYNPWSIINFLQEQKFSLYWVNTSSNALVGTLIREGSAEIKDDLWRLLRGEQLKTFIDEQIVFGQLDGTPETIWSFLMTSGYLKVDDYTWDYEGNMEYTLSITNLETRLMFERLIKKWFAKGNSAYNNFVKVLLKGSLKEMNFYMNDVSAYVFSSFDTGNHPSERSEPERFYHGFVLGLVVELKKSYVITSNRESGFGRYDVMLKPLSEADPAIIMEFKVIDPDEEKTLKDTVDSALKQIAEMNYDASLVSEGIPKGRIRHYGFAFEGKKVLIGSDS